MNFRKFICPYTKLKLKFNKKKNYFFNKKKKFFINDGILDFLSNSKLNKEEKQIKKSYDDFAQNYDKWIKWMFDSFYENESKIRNEMIKNLKIKKNFKILEIGCGTGRDTFFLEKKIGPKGKIFAQDFSAKMMNVFNQKFKNNKKVVPFISNSNQLPFEDNFFDAIYNFGSFNEFSDPKAVCLEFDRVLKKDGIVLIGDENIAPWLKQTTYAKIIENNNNIFERDFLPLKYIPENSTNVNLTWVIGKCFYLLTYKKGKSSPSLNLDLKHDSLRGGTLRTRFYGKLEGIDPVIKKIFYRYANKKKISVAELLEKLIKKELKK